MGYGSNDVGTSVEFCGRKGGKGIFNGNMVMGG